MSVRPDQAENCIETHQLQRGEGGTAQGTHINGNSPQKKLHVGRFFVTVRRRCKNEIGNFEATLNEINWFRVVRQSKIKTRDFPHL